MIFICPSRKLPDCLFHLNGWGLLGPSPNNVYFAFPNTISPIQQKKDHKCTHMCRKCSLLIFTCCNCPGKVDSRLFILFMKFSTAYKNDPVSFWQFGNFSTGKNVKPTTASPTIFRPGKPRGGTYPNSRACFLPGQVTQEVSSQQPPWAVRNRSNPRRLACEAAPWVPWVSGRVRPRVFLVVDLLENLDGGLDVPSSSQVV